MSLQLKLLFLIQICFLLLVLSKLWLSRRQLRGSSGHWQYLNQSKADLQKELAKELLRARSQTDFLLGQPEKQTSASSPHSRVDTDSDKQPTWPNWTEQTSFRDILQLSGNFTKKDIEKKYRELIKRYHPDRFSALGVTYERKAHEILLLVQAAKLKAETQISDQ